MPPTEEEANAQLVEAVSSAVDQATPEDVRPVKEPVEEPVVETPIADDKPPVETKDGEDPPAKDPAADRGDGRDSSGKFVKKQGETEADFSKRKDAAPPVDKTAAPAAPKKTDHVNDPIPVELKGKTRERMESLIGAAKTLTTERDDARAQLREFNDAITATGADPDTFANHMAVLEAMLSKDPKEQRSAVEMLRKAADMIATELGDTPTGKDPLEGHQDLLDDVEAGDIKRDKAIELANARNQRKAQDTRTERTNAQTREQQERQVAVDTARGQLNDLGKQLSASDPLFAQKAKILLPAVQEMAKNTHPTKWLTAYRAMYDKLELGPTVRTNGDTRERVPSGTGNRQPIRPKQGAGGGATATPTSIEEAVSFGIDQANRR